MSAAATIDHYPIQTLQERVVPNELLLLFGRVAVRDGPLDITRVHVDRYNAPCRPFPDRKTIQGWLANAFSTDTP
jgi:hypothetical protein